MLVKDCDTLNQAPHVECQTFFWGLTLASGALLSKAGLWSEEELCVEASTKFNDTTMTTLMKHTKMKSKVVECDNAEQGVAGVAR